MKVSFACGDARKLWRESTKAYALTVHEKLILKGACTALDKIAALEVELDGASLLSRGSMGQEVANPLLAELRSQQAAFDRAVKQLALPEPDAAGSVGRSSANRSVSARAAAAARWGL